MILHKLIGIKSLALAGLGILGIRVISVSFILERNTPNIRNDLTVVITY